MTDSEDGKIGAVEGAAAGSGSAREARKEDVVTRFAPSPTGFLHIGGARTALFNMLFARRHGGRFLLRIEDTDRKRSTDEAIRAIVEGLDWLGIHWDGEPVSQFSRRERHREVALELLERGAAYKCFATPEEIAAARERARAEKRPLRFDSPWRDADPASHPDRPFAIRLRAPREGETVIEDQVQGTVRVANAELDDMILLRSDGTPTYMLAVVVDDHDMGVTHVIRGDDHLTNAFRQVQLYHALGWRPPVHAHIPLIHGPDGRKLSKRHGALGVEAYREMGYLPEALRNYLLRLGWGHGDIELITTEEAARIFALEDIGKGPARFDFKKLDSFNGHYIRISDDARLVELTRPFLEERIGRRLVDEETALLERAMPGLKERAKTLVELAESARFLYYRRPIPILEDAARLLTDEARALLARLQPVLERVADEDWDPPHLEAAVQDFVTREGVKLKHIAQPLRVALTGSRVSPGIYDVLAVLGREESLARIGDATASREAVGDADERT